MRSVEERLREERERFEREHDPGPVLWAELPSLAWERLEAGRRRRTWRRRLFFVLAPALATAACVALLLRPHAPPPRLPALVVEPTFGLSPGEAIEAMDSAALERLARELDQFAIEDPTAGASAGEMDDLIEHLPDAQLRALSRSLGGG